MESRSVIRRRPLGAILPPRRCPRLIPCRRPARPCNATASALVFWTVAARRQLRQALAEVVGRRGARLLEDRMEELGERLRQLFPGARGVVVQQQFVGFRRRDDEFIFLVEVEGGERLGRHVVKLAGPERLQAELNAWETCRPHGLRHDLVFMTLDPGPHPERLIGLVYADAQQFLGGVATTSLEDAFLRAVQYGTPSAASVADALVQLYERVGHLLYAQWFVDDPARPDFILCVPRLETGWHAWRQPGSETSRIRQDVNQWASQEQPGCFRDPIDYLEFLCRDVAWLGDCPPGGGPPQLRRPQEGTADRTQADIVPPMLRGCGHGDLHGRNVLIGLVRDRARWPVLFDYENMDSANLLAWDFVKMEVELKVRAYPSLFSGERAREFVPLIRNFEIDLARRTEACHDGIPWPEVREPMTPVERLRTLLLVLRQQAARHLGADRGRPRQWLKEYYFTLALYGIQAGRFPTLTGLELIGNFVSAGVATARYRLTPDEKQQEDLLPEETGP